MTSKSYLIVRKWEQPITIYKKLDDKKTKGKKLPHI